MKKYEDFPSRVIFQFSPLKFVIQTWFCNCQQYLCLSHIVFECSPSIHDQGKMMVLPDQLLYWVLSTTDQCFVSFQPILCHPHTQIRIILFHDEQRDIPNLETFSQPCFNRIFSNCLSQNSPAKRWPYRFRSRGTTGSSILEHDCGHFVSWQTSPNVWTFRNFGASSIFNLVKADTASAACPAHPGSLEMISMILAAVIWDAEDPCSVNTA